MGQTASSTCRAANVSMRFSAGGQVVACCANHTYPLGQIGEQTIGEIWNGPELARLRRALELGDYSLGCQDCGEQAEMGHRLDSPASMYDRYPDGVAEWPRRLEFALSNTCNLQCIHCNGELSSAIRAQRERRPPMPNPYGEEFFAELDDYLPHLEVAVFIGGEPFLMRESRRIWDSLIERDLRPEVHVTTNGTVWNDKIARYARELDMHVTVSIDGFSSATNEAIRLGTDHQELTRNRAAFREIVADRGWRLGVNHCLMVQNWHELGDFLLDAEADGDLVHVIPVLYPSSDSLFCLPAGDLRPVVDALAAQSSSVASGLTVNRGVWLDSIAHLSDHLARLEAGELPVKLRSRQVVDTRELLATATAELEALTGCAPIKVHLADGVITEVEADPHGWAERLGAADWVGHRIDALDELVSKVAELGPLELDDSRPRIARIRRELRFADEALTLVALAVNQEESSSHLLMAILP